MLYVGPAGVRLVSLIVTLTLSLIPSSVRVNVSRPSVVASLAREKVAVAELFDIVKLPVKLAPISEVDTPDIVYGTVVASLRFVVVKVITILSPSLTLAAFRANVYVGVAAAD